jgi:hypothetical protein
VLFKLKILVSCFSYALFVRAPDFSENWEKSVKMVRYFSDLFQVVIRICGLVGGERDK